MLPGEWAIFGSVVLAHALAVASPGPDFAIVIRQSLAFGRGAGILTAAGIGSGILFHVGYGLFGLAWLTQRFPDFLTVIGYAGAGFLIFMGVQALRSKPADMNKDSLPEAQPGGSIRFFGVGLLTNILNPKAALFFVALFTAALTGPTSTTMQLALGLWLPLATFAWFAFVALVLGNPVARGQLRHAAHWIDRAMGVVLLLLGTAMLVELQR